MRTSHRGGFVERLEPRRLLAISLLGDFNTLTGPSHARTPVMLGSAGYMYANDGVHSSELWKTDGTPAGTVLLKDINPGPEGSGGSALQKAGGLLYFPAHDGSNELELWRSDGTAAGTFQLTDVATSNDQFLIGNVIDFNGTAIFGTNHWGVWRSDGTVAGTMQIAPAYASSLARLGDDLYFYGPALSGGTSALWKTDGTAAGTTPVRHFSDSFNATVVAMGGRLYFWADDSSLNMGREPWSSDGTSEGTVLLGDLVPGTASSSPANFTEFNGVVYFTATTVPNSWSLKLFRTDGTTGSATVIANIGDNGDAYQQPGLVAYNGALYFRGSETGSGSELWRSDGTPEGTGQFIDLNPGSASSSPSAFAIYKGRLYFKANTTKTGVEIFSTDGTVAGTRLLKDIVPGSKDGVSSGPALVVFNDRLYFRADDFFHGAELWFTDGTSEGTTMFMDINSSTNDFNPSALTAGPGGFHFFTAKDGLHGNGIDLWKTDGTAAGTSIVRNLAFPSFLQAKSFTFVNGLILFTAGQYGGWQLWRSDGTAAGTYRVDLAPGFASGLRDGNLVKVDERVFFAADTTTSYRHGLWVSDGTEAGTKLVKPSDSWFTIEQTFSGIDFNGKLLFLAASYPGPEWSEASLFISDGTNAGTTVVQSGFRNAAATNWTLFNGKAYFVATTVAEGAELWSTDGTPEGTVLVGDIQPGNGSSSPGNLVATSDSLYFTAIDRINGRELWRIGKGSSTPRRLTTLTSDVEQVQASAQGGVMFSTAAREIYRFDGSNLTALMTSVESDPVLHGPVGSFDYFTARTTADGGELWRTDGTPAGTLMMQDLAPGEASSWPINLSVIKGRILVSAWKSTVGRELFVVSPFTTAGDSIFPLVGAAAWTTRIGGLGENVAEDSDEEPLGIVE